MKKFRIAVSLCTALIIVFVSVTGVFAAKNFTDVPSNHWALSAITRASDAGIINGYPGEKEGTFLFKPGNDVSRQESLVMLYQTLLAENRLKTDEDLTEAYQDTLESLKFASWGRKFGAYALEYQIISEADFSGANATSVAPRRLIAKWTARALDLPFMPLSVLKYADAKAIGEDIIPYADAMYRYGLMNGDGSHNMNPDSGIRRCEFASVCVRLMDLKSEKSLANSFNLLYGKADSISADGSSFYFRAEGAEFDYRLLPETGASIIIDGKASDLNGLAALAGKSITISAVDGPCRSIVVTTGMQVMSGLVTAVQKCSDFTLVTIDLGGYAADFVLTSDSVSAATVSAGRTVSFIAEGALLLEVQ